MSEGMESVELTNELIMEEAKEQGGDSERQRWHKGVALTTLVLAMLAALGGLLAGITAHEAVLERTEEIINVTRMNREIIEVDVLKTKHVLLDSMGEAHDEAELEKIRRFEY